MSIPPPKAGFIDHHKEAADSGLVLSEVEGHFS
jgi:hypothetical protein